MSVVARAAAGTAAVAVLALAACSSGGSTASSGVGPVTTVQQPPSASAVASALHITGFTDCGPAPTGGVTDSGTAYKGSERVGIDTFPSQDIRDGWIKTAAKVGVVPAWEGTTWVAYRATKQSAKGCG